MFSPDQMHSQMPSQIEQVADRSMRTQEALSLTHRLVPPHTPLPDPGRFVRLVFPIILILLSTVDRLWNQLTMRTIAPQLFGHDLPGLATDSAVCH